MPLPRRRLFVTQASRGWRAHLTRGRSTRRRLVSTPGGAAHARWPPTPTQVPSMRAFGPCVAPRALRARSEMMRACELGSPRVAAHQATHEAARRCVGGSAPLGVRRASEPSDRRRAFAQRTRSSLPHRGAQHTLSAGASPRVNSAQPLAATRQPAHENTLLGWRCEAARHSSFVVASGTHTQLPHLPAVSPRSGAGSGAQLARGDARARP
jgi:hypothetical protein